MSFLDERSWLRRALRWAKRKRRWLGGSLSLHFVAMGQLRPVSDGKDIWKVTGNDPQFACSGQDFPIRSGWYHLDLELERLEGPLQDCTLYMDYGQGMHEAWSIKLGFVRPSDTRHEGLVLFTHAVRALRFDPAEAPCTFRCRGLRLKRLNRATAAWLMLHQLGQREGLRMTTWLPRLGRALAQPRGLHDFAHWLHGQYVRSGSALPTYERWLSLYDRQPPAKDEDGIKASGPLISILLPVYNTPEVWLRRCLDSVLAQEYSNWQLCIADDASTRPHVRDLLESYRERDARICIVWRESNGHIAAASNSALAMASGDYVALLDHDDELHPQALMTVAEALCRHPHWRLVYTDEDKMDADGRRSDPYFKPEWNADLLRGHNFFSHFGIYARTLVLEVGGFRTGLDGSQDWDLVLRCSEKLSASQIGHVPRVLYHWRMLPGSTALAVGEKDYAHRAGLRAVTEHLQRTEKGASAEEIGGVLGAFRMRYALPSPVPLVSIVIPTRDRGELLKQCVDSVVTRSTYANYEILVVDNGSSDSATLDYLEQLRRHPGVRVLADRSSFNFSRINNAAITQARGEVLCLLNNDVEVITAGWLEELVAHAVRPRVGAVGAMLYYPDDTIQHAGVVTGLHGVAGHPYCGMQRGFPGQMGRSRLAQELSAVTAACMVIRRSVYEKVGGLDESLEVAFNDIDLCLRLRQHGFANVWTPFAELYHHESASRGPENTPEKLARFTREVEFMRRRWAGYLECDPAYNPNLTLSGEPFSLAFPPRPWRSESTVSVAAASAPQDASGYRQASVI